ncbi:22997_t:CDS:1, partial [Gigaspora rosea]
IMFLTNYNPSFAPQQPNLIIYPNTKSREMTPHPEISNELEILSNVHYPLEFPTGITTPDDVVGQQINSRY